MNIHVDIKIYISFYILSIRASIILLQLFLIRLQLFQKSKLRNMVKLQTFPKDSNFTPFSKILVRTLEMLFGL